jgi:hypothetical protein
MKKLFLTVCAVFVFGAVSFAQNSTAVSASEATPVVNAADHMDSQTATKSCSPEAMKACGTAETKPACCAHKGSGEASASSETTGAALGKQGTQCQSVSVGMSAAKPEKQN